MVLQDKYARAASRRYQKTHAPTPEQAAEHAAVDAAIKEVEKRRLGTNADRYKDDDEAAARAEGRLAGGPEGPSAPADEEIDEEEGASMSTRYRRKARQIPDRDSRQNSARRKKKPSWLPFLRASGHD